MRKVGDGAEVLLIKDSYGRWTWAKGHIEEGETPEEAAVREISEETGLKELKILKELGKQEYFFTLKGEKTFKTVHVFLVEASGGEELNIQISEIQEGKWYSPEDALDRIEYKDSKPLLKKGIEIFLRGEEK